MDEQNRLQLYEPRQSALERVNHGAGTYPVEDREAVPDLLEYWRVIQKRYGTVLIALLVVFMIGLFATFRGKPVYEARALIEIQKENPDVPTLQELFQIEGVSDAYIETQNRILKSENLARRVITQLGLEKLPEFTRRSGSWQIAREKPAPEPMQAGFGKIDRASVLALAGLEGVDAVEPDAPGTIAIGVEIRQRAHMAARVPFLASRRAGMAADADIEIDDQPELLLALPALHEVGAYCRTLLADAMKVASRPTADRRQSRACPHTCRSQYPSRAAQLGGNQT